MKKSTILLVLALPVFFVLGTIGLQITNLTIDYSTFNLNALSRFSSRVFPPDFSEIVEILPLFNQTLLMTLWGTTIGALLAFIASLFFGNKQLSGSKVSRILVTAVAIVSRSVPDLLIALIFVAIVGAGTLAGIFALAISSIGMFVRLLSTRIEEISIDRSTPFVATGMSRTKLRAAFVSREIWPYFVSIFGYRLDINLRAAATLGLAGAGGVGVALKMAFGSLNYPTAMAIVIVIAVGLLLIELISNQVSRKLEGEISDSKFNQSPIFKSARFVALSILGIYMITGLLKSIFDSHFDQQSIGKFIAAIFSPDFVSRGSDIWNAILQSVSLALLGTFFGCILALLVGIGGSRRSGLPSWVFYFSRVFLVLKRSAPTILFAIVFVIIFGMGSLAGIAALTLGVGGIGAKFIADSLDQIPQNDLLPVRALGLSKAQFLFSGILRISLPTVVKHLLYMLELNVRYAAILGIIGVGGIGVLVTSAIRNDDLATTFAVIYAISALVAILELTSRRFTKALV